MALLAALALAAGCGKKGDSSATSTTTNAPAANADTTPKTPEMIMNDRSLAFLKSLVDRKDYKDARVALHNLDGKTLTPEQQKAFDDLKAQIPAE